MHTIELRDITKTFGSHLAVDNLTLNVPKGSVYGFIGPNGSGKTTTLRMIMNILYPDSGQIRIFDQDLSPAIVNRIGYMPEERGLYKRMKVRELLVFLARLKQSANPVNEVNGWLKRLDLLDWADKKVETLSKGMGQKVQFIATVVSNPELIILDEPFTGLDPVNTDVIKDAILELQKAGTTVIFSTHDMSMAEKMCDFIFMIFKGQKVLDGTLNAIQEKYGNDTIRLRIDDGAIAMQDIKGIEKVNDFGQVQELRLKPNSDPHFILKTIMAKTRVWSFDIVKPSLHDIFVRIAGEEANNA
jgi:ABC-2 type transport system ATP-binding protein